MQLHRNRPAKREAVAFAGREAGLSFGSSVIDPISQGRRPGIRDAECRSLLPASRYHYRRVAGSEMQGVQKTSDRIEHLINNLTERLDVEVKNWLNGPRTNDDKARLAKEIIALANSVGGDIFIGFEDEGAGHTAGMPNLATGTATGNEGGTAGRNAAGTRIIPGKPGQRATGTTDGDKGFRNWSPRHSQQQPNVSETESISEMTQCSQ